MNALRKHVVVAIWLVALLAGGPAAGATTDSSVPPPHASVPLYLALGDSLAVGVGASDPEETAYVPVFHDYLRQSVGCDRGMTKVCPELGLLNLGVSGATTTTMLRDQLPVALQVLGERNGDDDARNDVERITVDIGGNDAFALYGVCSAGVTAGCVGAVQTTFAAVAQNLTTALANLRGVAGADTQIIVMTYYNALIGCDRSAAAPMADALLEGGAGLPAGLNDLIRASAAQAGAAVAETYGQLGTEDLVGGSDCLHPVDSGYRIIADAFAATWEAGRDRSSASGG